MPDALNRIGIDFDGVVTDTIPAMIEFARTTHGLQLSPFDCVAPDGPAGLDRAAFTQLILDTHATPFALSIPETDGATAAIRRLASTCEVMIVTARVGPALENAVEWLRQAGLSASLADVISSGGRSKAEVAAQLELDALLDDFPANLRGFADATAPILWDAIYNRDADVDSRVVRVAGWHEFESAMQARLAR